MKITLELQSVSIDADQLGFYAELSFGLDYRSNVIERIKIRSQAEAEALFLAMGYIPEGGNTLSASLIAAVGQTVELTYIRTAPLPEDAS